MHLVSFGLNAPVIKETIISSLFQENQFFYTKKRNILLRQKFSNQNNVKSLNIKLKIS